MSINYHLEVDAAGDGTFTVAITPDVLRVGWRLGLHQPYDTMAAPSAAQITVRNASGRYSPGAPQTLIEIGQTLRIRACDDGDDFVFFTGQISRIEPQPGDLSARMAIIHVEGAERRLHEAIIRLPPQIMVRADEVIEAVLDQVGVPAGEPSHHIEVGRTTFTYVADNWTDGVSAWEAIRQVTDAERGRFFVDRDGCVVFYNRHHTLLNTAPLAAFDNDMEGADLQYDADRVSAVRVRLRPRQQIAGDTVLWQVPNAQVMPSVGRSHTIVARFRDDLGRPAGALLVIPPRPGIDYSANTRRDGTGDEVTAQVEVTMERVDFSAAVLRLRSTLQQTIYLMPGMQLVGTPVYGGDPITLEHTDAASAALYGPRVLSVDLPALDSIEQGDDLARFELGRRRLPRVALRAITTSTRSHPDHILALSLFDAISVQDAHTGHTGTYIIVAENHAVDMGGCRHRVTWTLEPVDPRTYWRLDRHRLDSETVLAF